MLRKASLLCATNLALMKITKFLKRKYNKIFKKYLNFLYWGFVIFVIILGITVLLSVFNIGGMRIFSVASGSMNPKIFPGSLAIVIPQKNYIEGDVITYQIENPASKTKSTITHRIIEKFNNNDQPSFVTKGDKNPSEDPAPIDYEQILGKVIFSVPLIGYASSFAKTPLGLFLLIIIPGILIVVSEIIKITTNFYFYYKKEVI